MPLRLASCFNISSHLLIRLCEIILPHRDGVACRELHKRPRLEVATLAAHGADRICRSEVRGTMAQRSFLTVERIPDWLPIAVFVPLPIVGLVAGPSFAALIFGLGIIQFGYAVAVRRTLPSTDRVLLWLAIAFAGLCWASVIWSIVPDRSMRGALQVTGIFAASIAVLSSQAPSKWTADWLFRLMQIAFALSAITIAIDASTGYYLQSLFTAATDAPATKYNRGADHLVLIAWPLLAQASSRRQWPGVFILAVSAACVLVFGVSMTGRIAALVGIVVLGASLLSRRIVSSCLVVATAVVAVFTPFWLWILGEHRALVASRLLYTPHLRQSGLHRLEIWDYMSARVFERPVLGWGLWSSKSVPIHRDELSQYLYANAQGIYPHNQWLQLWLETGGIGVALALTLALVTLTRARKSLTPNIQPFGYAAFASALTISLANFEITTDSWWAALVACAYLFAAFRCHATDETTVRPPAGGPTGSNR
jgi:exopolysaccharide production protein ExoQ